MTNRSSLKSETLPRLSKDFTAVLTVCRWENPDKLVSRYTFSSVNVQGLRVKQDCRCERPKTAPCSLSLRGQGVLYANRACSATRWNYKLWSHVRGRSRKKNLLANVSRIPMKTPTRWALLCINSTPIVSRGHSSYEWHSLPSYRYGPRGQVAFSEI